jgi:hypothetical protein
MQGSKEIKFENTEAILLNVNFCTSYTNMPLQYDIYVTTTSMLQKQGHCIRLEYILLSISCFSVLKEWMPILVTHLLGTAVIFVAKCKS